MKHNKTLNDYLHAWLNGNVKSEVLSGVTAIDL